MEMVLIVIGGITLLFLTTVAIIGGILSVSEAVEIEERLKALENKRRK